MNALVMTIMIYATLCGCVFVSRHLKRGEEYEKQATEPVAHVDYSLKQGQKISLKIGNKLKLHGDDDDDVKPAERPSPVGEFKCLYRVSTAFIECPQD